MGLSSKQLHSGETVSGQSAAVEVTAEAFSWTRVEEAVGPVAKGWGLKGDLAPGEKADQKATEPQLLSIFSSVTFSSPIAQHSQKTELLSPC